MAEPASVALDAPLRVRLPSAVLDAIDAVASQTDGPARTRTRSAALRALVLEALAARGVSVAA